MFELFKASEPLKVIYVLSYNNNIIITTTIIMSFGDKWKRKGMV